jgi:hypothetical protein
MKGDRASPASPEECTLTVFADQALRPEEASIACAQGYCLDYLQSGTWLISTADPSVVNAAHACGRGFMHADENIFGSDGIMRGSD